MLILKYTSLATRGIHLGGGSGGRFVSLLNTTPQLLVDECEIAASCTVTAVLERLSLGSLQNEGGKSLDILALDDIWLLVRVHHLYLALLASHGYFTIAYHLLEIGLHCLTMRAPVCIIHSEGAHCPTGILESLEIASITCRTEAGVSAAHIKDDSQYDCDTDTNVESVHIDRGFLEEPRTFYS